MGVARKVVRGQMRGVVSGLRIEVISEWGKRSVESGVVRGVVSGGGERGVWRGEL